MGALDPRVTAKVAGNSWALVRDKFLGLCTRMLDVADDTRADLTTIYVKFSVSGDPGAEVYAVAWIKQASNVVVVVGFALPEHVEHELLTAAPPGMTYRGLTKYFRLPPSGDVPDDLDAWAKTAFEHARARSGLPP